MYFYHNRLCVVVFLCWLWCSSFFCLPRHEFVGCGCVFFGCGCFAFSSPRIPVPVRCLTGPRRAEVFIALFDAQCCSPFHGTQIGGRAAVCLFVMGAPPCVGEGHFPGVGGPEPNLPESFWGLGVGTFSHHSFCTQFPKKNSFSAIIVWGLG